MCISFRWKAVSRGGWTVELSRNGQVVFTVLSVTTLSTVAMVIYPLLIALFALDDQAIGLFLGGTIHDVAQVVGAGYSVSPEVGDFATITKLFRVLMLIPVMRCPPERPSLYGHVAQQR